jgi:hypothetical protein
VHTHQLKIYRQKDKYTPDAPSSLMFQLTVLTWLEHNGEAADPWLLARHLIPKLTEISQSDRVQAEYSIPVKGAYPGNWIDGAARSENWDRLMEINDELLHINEDFPHRIAINRRGSACITILTGFWDAIGGPEPYHDSVALYLYSDCDRRRLIEETLTHVAGPGGIITATHPD